MLKHPLPPHCCWNRPLAGKRIDSASDLYRILDRSSVGDKASCCSICFCLGAVQWHAGPRLPVAALHGHNEHAAVLLISPPCMYTTNACLFFHTCFAVGCGGAAGRQHGACHDHTGSIRLGLHLTAIHPKRCFPAGLGSRPVLAYSASSGEPHELVLGSRGSQLASWSPGSKPGCLPTSAAIESSVMRVK